MKRRIAADLAIAGARPSQAHRRWPTGEGELDGTADRSQPGMRSRSRRIGRPACSREATGETVAASGSGRGSCAITSGPSPPLGLSHRMAANEVVHARLSADGFPGSPSSIRSILSPKPGSPACSAGGSKCRSYTRICGESQVGTCTPLVM